MIEDDERRKMLAVRLCGERVLLRLESPMAIAALQNLIDAAEREHTTRTRRR